MIFYAACIPQNTRKLMIPSNGFNPEHFISENKDDILKLIKRFKNSRFKSFNEYDEALKFVLEENCDIINETSNNNNDSTSNNSNSLPKTDNNNSSNQIVEESPPFPSLDITEINVFKRAITNKQIDLVKKYVHDNPRYLISNYFDSPTIIVQGARYNSVHLSIRSRCPEILDFILTTINSLDFVQKMNPNFNNESLIEKRDHLLDLYLNTPDKINFDTPLHMACKFVDLECIKILTSYMPIIDTEKLNKQNLLPYQVVQDNAMKQTIYELINSSVFITITKSVDNLDKSLTKSNEIGKKIIESSLKSTPVKDVKISAIVGPMTKEKSQKMYEIFKSPKRLTPEQRRIRLQDPEHGLEHVVCELSKQFDLEYCEYYTFMGEFVDFSLQKDLKKFNDYLQRKHDELYLSKAIAKLKIIDDDGDEFFDALNESTLNSNDDNYEDDDDEDNDIYYTPPSSPLKNNEHMIEKIMYKNYYINGERKEKIDEIVFDSLKLAFEKHWLNKIDDDNDHQSLLAIKSQIPYLIHWYCNVGRTKFFI